MPRRHAGNDAIAKMMIFIIPRQRMISGLFSDIYSFLFGALAPADVLRQLAVIVLCMGLGWGNVSQAC